jgi:hypothetical protein
VSSWAINDYAFNANVSLPANAALGIFSAQAYSTSYGTGGDDTAAIQAACNAAATAGGGVAFLPPPKSGTLNVSSTIVLGSGVSLVGASGGVTITVVPGSQLNWVISPLTATASDPVTICAINYRSLTLGGNTYNTFNPASPVSLANGGSLINVNLIADTNPGGSRQYGLMLNAVSGFTVDNVGVYGFIQGISVWDSYDTLIRRVTGNTGQATVAVNRACYNTMLDSCTGFNANAADPFYVTASNFTFPVSTTVNLSPMFTKIVDCHGYGTAAYAVYLGGVAYANLTSSTGDTTSGLYQTVTVNGTPCFGVLTDTGAVNSLAVTGPITNTGTATNPVIGLSTPLAVTYGGTGSTTANLTGAGGIAVTGTWPNQTLTLGAASTLNQVSWFSVKDYGATGNGSTDDTTSIQNAINACSTAGGGWVWIPRGTYKLSTTLTLPSKVSLVGQGADQSVFAFTQTTTSCVQLSSGAVYNTITGIYFNPQNVCTSGGCITAPNANNYLYIDQCTFAQTYWNGIELYGNSTAACLGVIITRCYFSSGAASHDSISIGVVSSTYSCADVWIYACTLGGQSGNNSGIHLQNAQGFYIGFVDIFQNGYGLLIDPPSGVSCYNGFIFDMDCDLSGGSAVYMNPANSSTAKIYQICFTNCWSAGSQGVGISMNPNNYACIIDTISFVQQRCLNNSTVSNTYGWLLGGGCTNINISNSMIIGNKGTGIILANTNNDVTIIGNRIGNDTLPGGSTYTGQTYGIVVNTAPASLLISGNDFGTGTTANSTSAILLSATGAGVRIKGNFGVNRGWIATPTITLNTATQNTTGFDCIYSFYGGAVTGIYLGGTSGGLTATGQTTGMLYVAAGSWFQVNGTTAPTCQQFAADS